MDKLIKLINQRPGFKNILKVGALGSWIMYLVMANTYDLLIEAFVLSIMIVVIGYFIFGSHHDKTTGGEKSHNRNSAKPNPIQSDHYLKIFFIQ